VNTTPKRSSASSPIPTSLTEKQFDQHVRPNISVAKRGFECSIPMYKVFNDILYNLHTGCQWEMLLIEPDPDDPRKKSVHCEIDP